MIIVLSEFGYYLLNMIIMFVNYNLLGTQGRRQGVCLGGGGGGNGKISKFLAENCASPEKVAQRGVGGGGVDSDTFFSSKNCCGKIYTIMGYIEVLSWSPFVTELTSKKKKKKKKKKIQNHGGGGGGGHCPPPDAAPVGTEVNIMKCLDINSTGRISKCCKMLLNIYAKCKMLQFRRYVIIGQIHITEECGCKNHCGV